MSLHLLIGELSIRFAPDGILPINESCITDDSADTCTTFQARDNASLQLYTHFRIKPSVPQKNDTKVIITGARLGCGHNLYVSAISAEQSKSWLGRWSTFNLLDTSGYDKKESCSYLCTFLDDWSEIQVLKIPHSSDEYFWKICHINMNVDYSGECSHIFRFVGLFISFEGHLH